MCVCVCVCGCAWVCGGVWGCVGVCRGVWGCVGVCRGVCGVNECCEAALWYTTGLGALWYTMVVHPSGEPLWYTTFRLALQTCATVVQVLMVYHGGRGLMVYHRPWYTIGAFPPTTPPPHPRPPPPPTNPTPQVPIQCSLIQVQRNLISLDLD